jgi:hypothetical protein
MNEQLILPIIFSATRRWMCSLIEELTCALIRPPKYEYDAADLGPLEGDIRGSQFKRQDFDVSLFFLLTHSVFIGY